MGDRDSGDWLDLADAIELLRDQIVEAQERSPATGVRFALGEITVEFALELSRSRGAGGGLRFYVAEANARAERASSNTHRVVVTLRPKRSDGGDVEVDDEDG